MGCNCSFVLLKSIRILPEWWWWRVSGYYKECVSRDASSEIKNVIMITWRTNNYKHFLSKSQRKKNARNLSTWGKNRITEFLSVISRYQVGDYSHTSFECCCILTSVKPWLNLPHYFAESNARFWGRKWQPTPVSLPGKFHGQRSLASYSPWGRKELD